MDVVVKKLGFSLLKLVGVCCIAVVFANSSRGDVLYMMDNTRVFGRFDGSNSTHIFFKQRIGANQYRDRTIRRDAVLTLVVTIDTERLAALAPQRPAEYFDYAEELSVAKVDPEARELALRLFLLAAHLDKKMYAESAFLAMIQIARNPGEQNRIRALAYQTLPDSNRKWLFKSSNHLLEEQSDENPAPLLAGIKLLRQGNRTEADKLLKQADSQKLMQKFNSICSWDHLRSWAAADQLTHAQLAKLLQLEIAVSGIQRQDAMFSKPMGGKWSTIIRTNQAPIFRANSHSVLEFDPTLCVYRDGAWVLPNN